MMTKKDYKKRSTTLCEHDYEFTQGYDDELYVCKKCGDRYRLYYEDMK